MSANVGIPAMPTEETDAFWAAAAEGRLVVERCRACGTSSFPPYGACRQCRGRSMEWVDVTGTGTVYSLTVNQQRWLPDLEVLFAVVLVDLDDHPGVRIVGRLRGIAPEDATIGMKVRAGTEPGPDGTSIPSFEAVTR
ncbi:MAG TPA: OB-fold domain-containing protein [Mycobacteriales bacterium]|nr:OB-fold domain-containing protein [Mycobacteriales bacterium]